MRSTLTLHSNFCYPCVVNNSAKITVYEANSREKIGFFQAWIIMYRNILNSRELIFVLFKRDFFAVYKKSFLGMAWIFIAPLIGALSWIFMNATGILNPGDVGVPYTAYVLLSSSIWGLFMGFYSSAQGTISAGAGIINQVKYPHEVLLVKQIAQHLAAFIISFIINLFILIAFGVIPSWKTIFFPALALPLLFLGAGIGLFISVFSVVLPEIQKGFDILMGLLIWITPVIYSTKTENPSLQKIINWNPLTYLIGAARDIIIYGEFHYWRNYFVSLIFSLVVFLISWKFFFITEDKVIEKMQ